MAGVKGKSGRKSWDKEFDATRLWIMSNAQIIKVMESPDTPEAVKTDIAKSIIIKMMPSRVEGEVTQEIYNMGAVEIDDKTYVPKIGDAS
jgi:hypothetical protein